MDIQYFVYPFTIGDYLDGFIVAIIAIAIKNIGTQGCV